MAVRPAPSDKPPRFTIRTFRRIGERAASIYDADQFFMKLETEEAAIGLVSLLNAAHELAGLEPTLFKEGADHAFHRRHVAYAVAKSLGGSIDIGSFSKARAA